MTTYTYKHIKTGETVQVIAGSQKDALRKLAYARQPVIEANLPAGQGINKIAALYDDSGIWAEAIDGHSGAKETGRRVKVTYTKYRKTPRADSSHIVIADPSAPATEKQIALIRRLAQQVDGGSIAIRTERAVSGAITKGEASRLIDDMLAERH